PVLAGHQVRRSIFRPASVRTPQRDLPTPGTSPRRDSALVLVLSTMPYSFNPSDRASVFARCFASSLLPTRETEGRPITLPVSSRWEMVATSPSRLSSIFRRTDTATSCNSVLRRGGPVFGPLGNCNAERKPTVDDCADQHG